MRVIIVLLGLVVLVPCILFFPSLLFTSKIAIKAVMDQTASSFEWMYISIYIAMYPALIPFCIAIYQTLKLLGHIDNKETFSEKSVKALNTIRNCAVAILAIYIVGVLPIMCYFAIYDDTLGAIIVWGAFALIPMAIAIFASMLMNLIKEAIEIKSENDLTI
jgi:Protein of unknown function (DUF3036).